MHYWTLDLYRFFAALLVSTSHFFLYQSESSVAEYTSILGVELFFVLSGFVLAPQLIKLRASSVDNTKVFLIRRWMRTIPAYVVALTCAAIMFGYGDATNLVRFLTYTQNIVSDSPSLNFFPVAWSLSVEEWFYILTPVLILVTSKLKKGGIDPIYMGLSVITLLSIVKIAFNDGVDWGEDIRRSVVFRLDAIYFGLIAYLIKDKIKIKFLIFVSITSSIFLINVGINPKTLSESILLQNLFLPICSLFFGSILIILTLIRFESKKIISISQFCANISYSMYLFHFFFIYLISNVFNNGLLSFIIYFLSLVIYCFLFYYYFERSILAARPKYRQSIIIKI